MTRWITKEEAQAALQSPYLLPDTWEQRKDGL